MAEATANVRGPVVRGNIDVRSKRRRTRAYYSNRVRYYVRPTKKENTLVKMFTKITFVNAAIKLSTLSYPGHSYNRATSGRVKKPFPSVARDYLSNLRTSRAGTEWYMGGGRSENRFPPSLTRAIIKRSRGF